MVTDDDDSDLKIVDFGLSKIIGPNESSLDPFGTLSYVAPEVLLQKPYGKEVDIFENNYSVVAIKETVLKSSIKNWKIGDEINLERAMKIGDRLDGHLVQGHVDQIAICEDIKEEKGSWYFSFKYKKSENITIEKGSISVNGISLTVVNSKTNKFSVAIIPYTYNHTNFKNLKVGDTVNLEFDMVGKYISKLVSQ